MEITFLIRDLLLRNQKAVIPGFGSFLIQQRPAQLNKISGSLTPPSKVILFDRNQQEDDGLLTEYLMLKHKQNKATALGTIRQFSKSAADQLMQAGKLVMEGLGTLTVEKSGGISFIPDEELAKRERFFELPKLDIPAGNKVPPSQEKIPEKNFVVTAKRKKSWWIPAAVLALLIGLAAVVYYSGIVDRFMTGNETIVVGMDSASDADKLVFGKRDESDNTLAGVDSGREKISRELDERISRQKALAIEEAKNQPVAEPEPENPVPVQTLPASTGKPYHIIGGAFMVPNNAERLKANLEKKGLSPVLLPKRGNYYMLSLGSYDTHEQATEVMRQLRGKLDQEMWVMKR